MKRNRIKEAFILLRNGMAFTFSWLVICIIAASCFSGKESISIVFLIELLVLCFWAVICFIICFMNLLIRKKGFIFRLTLYYAMFIPIEVIGFYSMKMFDGRGSYKEWGIFAGLIIFLYVVCVLVDWMVFRKQGEIYTRSLLAYNERRTDEQNTGDGSGNKYS